MKNNGFTIIELIIVIAILGTLMAIAAISGRDWLERYRVEGLTRQVYTDLMTARVTALQRNRMFFVTLPTPNLYAIYEDTNEDLTLELASDRLVMQKGTQYVLNFSEDFRFTQDGLVVWDSTATGVTISVTSSTVTAASDCIALSTTRILMGKMNGTTCYAQ